MNKEKKTIKPFVKWVGGKTQLLDVIRPLLPKKYNNYIEPFLGGGAVLLDTMPNKALVNDLNNNVINAFQVVKDQKDLLVKKLKEHVKKHNKDYYYAVRDMDENNLTDVEKAARFIYLNKTGYNGLYRVNSKGKINVPFNNKENISNGTIFENANLDKISFYLNENDIIFRNCDFLNLYNDIQKDDFVFVDPPYDSDDDKSFDQYTKRTFGKAGQKALAEFLIKLDQKGVKWMLTNHNTKLINELYSSYEKFLIPVNRFVNSNASNRVNATYEIIIINYNITEEQRNEFKNRLFYKELYTTSYVLNDYVSWEHIIKRLNVYDIEMNDLNYLYSKSKVEFLEKFCKLYDKRQDSFKLLPLLLAKRLKDKETFTYLLSNGAIETFNYKEKDKVLQFIEESGLADNIFISNEYAPNIRSYVMGVEVGLTSNDKKNKSGLFMVRKISDILNNKNIKFDKEVSYNQVLNIQLDDDKRFDFVFRFNNITYCLECNFFNGSGSKINSETKRFIELDNEFKKYSALKFIWVTDGEGLKKNSNIIDKALNEVKGIYNLARFEKFIDSL